LVTVQQSRLRRFWVELAAGLVAGIACAQWYGWRELPPETAPMGFRLPWLLPLGLILAVEEFARLVKASRAARGGHNAQVGTYVGLILETNAKEVLFLAGLVLVILCLAVYPSMRAEK
jgi:hypothetical protein